MESNKIVHIGRMTDGELFAKITIKDGNLSIRGVVGPMKNGDSRGGCEQVIMEFKEYDKRGYYSLADITPAIHWTPEAIKFFFDVWDEWHLNDLQAACEHQRELGWTYEEHHDKKTFQGEPCPICGYKIGSAWLKKEVPGDVVSYLNNLPDTDITPTWI
jgi:hypothetical protein